MQRDSGFEIFQLFAESVGEPGKSAAVHPQRVILFFNVACGNQVNLGIPLFYTYLLERLFGGETEYK